MGKTDYYEILGVDKNADESALKKAYRSLAMNCHPDRNPDDSAAAQKMSDINEAYAVLSDREKRHIYDTYGHSGLEGLNQGDIFGNFDFADILSGFFGGNMFSGQRSRGNGRPQRGADLRYDLAIGLEEVAFGKDVEIEYSISDTCLECNGMGSAKGGLKECSECHGSGQSVKERRNGSNIIRQISACNKCKGKGTIVTDPCGKCRGTGSVENNQKINVHVPKGADTGYSIKVEGRGASGKGGNGDLYVVLDVKKHPVFERHGDDIYVVKEVDFSLAALGGELDDVPGLEKNLKVKIPEGIQSGTLIKVENSGMPRLNSQRKGDEYIVIKVVTPTNLSAESKELLRKFEETRKRNSKN